MSVNEDQRRGARSGDGEEETHELGGDEVRDIHELLTDHPQALESTDRRRRPVIGSGNWEVGSQASSSFMSNGSQVASSENFTTLSREFNALVLAGNGVAAGRENIRNLPGIGEDDDRVDDHDPNPLAIVLDNGTLDSRPAPALAAINRSEHVPLQRVKKEETEAKISAWLKAKLAKINNRFKREEAFIHSWESAQVDKAAIKMKKIERKLEERRAKANEKMQNAIAKARRKAEERKATVEAKRGTRASRAAESANLMKAVGRTPSKMSLFS